MANTYFTMTGLLLAKEATPVIRSLFSVFELNLDRRAEGFYIANISESSSLSWTDIGERLRELAEQLGLEVTEEEEDDDFLIQNLLYLLGDHFGQSDNSYLLNLIEHINFDDDVDLFTAFNLARYFDDGHGLTGYKTMSSWHCDKARLFEFGGCGEFTGTHVSLETKSVDALVIGQKIEQSIEAKDFDLAAKTIEQHVQKILVGIYDQDVSDQIKASLIEKLSTAQVN